MLHGWSVKRKANYHPYFIKKEAGSQAACLKITQISDLGSSQREFNSQLVKLYSQTPMPGLYYFTITHVVVILKVVCEKDAM